MSEIGGKRERRIFCVHFPHSLFLCDLEPPLTPPPPGGGSHGGRTLSLLLSSSNLISSHFSISILSSLTISFSKKCHTLGQLSPICPVLSLRALCSSGSEGCALRGVLGKAESNPQRQTACECPLLWFPGRWSLVSNPPFRSLVSFSNPAAESSALGWSPLFLHTCTNTRRCGAQPGETP